MEGLSESAWTALKNLTHFELLMASSATCLTGRLSLNAITLFRAFINAQVLIVSAGDINGTFPESLDMPQLRTLHLSPTDPGTTLSLYGSVSIRNLTRLESLKLHATTLVGIDLYQLRLRNLHTFEMKDSTMFVETLLNLGNAFPNLVRLDCSGTRLDGQLHTVQFSLHLETLILSGSRVTSSMFYIMGFPTKLKHIDLSNTLADGPLSFEPFPHLEVLLLSGTLVRGPIPHNISKSSNLTRLDLSFLNLGGIIPESLYELRKLESLNLELAYLQNASISAAIGNLSNLKVLSLADCNLLGTIPDSLDQLTSLVSINLRGNYLEGSIPAGLRAENVDLSSNRLEGPVPELLLQHSVNLDLHQNRLGPTLNSTLMGAKHPGGGRFDLSDNSFAGDLPTVYKELGLVMRELDLSHNNFTGDIVRHAFANVIKLDLSYNSLSVGLENVLGEVISNIEHISLAHNKFEGSLPTLLYSRSFKTIDVSFNAINRGLPPLSPYLVEFRASNNVLGGDKTDLQFIASVITSPNLKVIDLSNSLGRLSQYLEALFYSNLTHLALSSMVQSNHLQDRSPIVASEWLNEIIRLSYFPTNVTFNPSDAIFHRSLLESLDISDNYMTGTFPRGRPFPALRTLNVAGNLLQQVLPIHLMPNIAQLNLSSNGFEFDVADFSGLGSLTSLDVSNNRLFGVIGLNEVPLLQLANFAKNQFQKVPDLLSFESHFRQYALRTLNIAQNDGIPRFKSLDFASVGLNMTSSTSPSASISGAFCRALAFDLTHPDRVFYYDEDLFNYNQCECGAAHFGEPSKSCLKCPDFGAQSCNALYLTSSPNSFLFPVFGNNASTPTHSALDSNATMRIEGESCVFNLMQQFSGLTSCSGTRISAHSLLEANVSVDDLLDRQCATGSGGNLCSQCYCNDTKCYYFGGSFCKECSFVFSTTPAAIALTLGLIALFIALTILFYLILRSKRFFSGVPWKDLNFAKKALYRILLLNSLGNVTILITFVQLLAEVTHWEKYALSVILRVLNGATEGVGLECALPFLRNPFTYFILRITLPIMAVSFVSTSVFIAEVLHAPSKYLPCLRRFHDGSDAEKLPILSPNPAAKVVEYPATALASSVAISVLRFFYFGTAISASDYLFSRSQPYTGVLYSRNYPWMLFSDAKPFINASIPTLLVFALILPFAFIYLCYRLRHTYNLEGITIYFGSLWDNYTARFFWWEIVNIFRKLAIAFSIRGLSSTSALQPLTVGLIMGVTQFAVLTLMPWRRKLENLADALSQLLLLFSLFSSRAGALSQSYISNNLMVSLDAAFVLASIVYVLYLTFTEPTTYHIRLSLGLPQKSQFLSTNHDDIEADWNLITGSSSTSSSGESVPFGENQASNEQQALLDQDQVPLDEEAEMVISDVEDGPSIPSSSTQEPS